MSYEAALAVVRAASAYRMIETGVLHRALGLSVLPQDVVKAAEKLDAALDAYEEAKPAASRPAADTGANLES